MLAHREIAELKRKAAITALEVEDRINTTTSKKTSTHVTSPEAGFHEEHLELLASEVAGVRASYGDEAEEEDEA